MHFSIVLLFSIRSSQIFLHAARDSRLSSNSWFPDNNRTSSRCSAWLLVSYFFPFFFLLLSLDSGEIPALLGSSTGTIDKLGELVLDAWALLFFAEITPAVKSLWILRIGSVHVRWIWVMIKIERGRGIREKVILPCHCARKIGMIYFPPKFKT